MKNGKASKKEVGYCTDHNKPICGTCGYCVEDPEHKKHIKKTPKSNKRILSISIKQETDLYYNGEDSIGTFDMEAKSEYAIPLEHWEDSHGYRYDGGFKFYNAPVHNYTGESPEDTRTYVQQDFESMKTYNAGYWDYIGIRAVCKIQLTLNGTIQTLTSGGLWGIESNSGSYLKEVETEQLSELRTELKALGFSTRAISAAFKNVERKED